MRRVEAARAVNRTACALMSEDGTRVQAKAISPESAVSAKAEEPEVQQACETNTDSKAEGCAVLSAKAKCVHPTCAPKPIHTPPNAR